MSGPAQQIEWYLARDGQQYGPVSEAELRKIIELGHLREEDLVWRDGFPEWREARTVFPDELARTAAPPPPPPVQPPPSPEPAGAHPLSGSAQGGPRGEPEAGTVSPNSRSEPAGRGAATASPQAPHAPQGAPGAHGAHGATSAPAAPRQDGPGGEATAAGPHVSRERFAPHDRRQTVETGTVSARLEEAQNRERPSIEDVSWDNSRPHHAAVVAANKPMARPPQAEIRRPAEYGDDFDDMASPPQSPRGGSSVGRVLWSIVLAVVVGIVATFGWLMYTNSDAAMRLYSQVAGSGEGVGQPPVVEAPTTNQREAAPAVQPGAETAPPGVTETASASPTRPEQPAGTAVNEGVTEAREPAPASPLFGTPLWASFQSGFPDWADKITQKAGSMKSAGASDTDISKVVLQSLVELRRSNASTALKAPPDNLKAIAQAFVSNLKFLRQTSVAACYGFIAEGDMNASVLPLMSEPSRSGPLLNQSTAVFRAIEAGKQSELSYGSPTKEDFDALSDELRRRGWAQEDLKLFSDPQALSSAPHDQVCKLVTDWFETQLSLPDGDRKMRLLNASLNPVVAG